ncbi:MAG: hypothetical protein H0T89_25470 [Deltaproteobacteria bacterium]|nr:hypothetical protein [Deltaproteobacteria bacterium]MDQ3295669.1 hypothetical protein [Myxococcota bacterium]
MKCSKCQSDCTYPQRSDGRCPTCKHRFAFEPRTGDIISDAGFQSALDAVSSFGSVRFLPDHVYYELARRRKASGVPRTVMFAFSGVAVVAAIVATPLLLLGAATFAGIGAMLKPRPTLNVERSTFDTMWRRWIAINGQPKGLIVRREAAGTPYRHSDVQHYSFDRAVICDRPETVDLLLANNFHFENNCAVLAVTGYPEHAFSLVREMLKNNPRLSVYALHDATPEGCGLAHRLASDERWFRGSARVVEVGMRPAHARKFKGVWTAASGTVDKRYVTDDERMWLEKYRCELAAIRPEQVIKRLFTAITTEATLEQASTYVESGGDYWVDSYSFSKDSQASDGGDDSFG